jgi:hypothetical protein
MNIGIFTYHSAHNYGAMLQACALRKHLEMRGHYAELIDFHPESLELSNSRRKPIRGARDFAAAMAFRILANPLGRRYRNFERFKEDHMHLGKRYRTVQELVDDPPEYDAYICGSDQIWNTDGGVSPVNFLQFAPTGSLKISYAPSIGTETVQPQHLQTMSDCLSSFSAISVREESARKILGEVLPEPPVLVADPVFLLDRDDWESIAVAPSLKGGYIAFYALESGPELYETVNALSRTHGLPIVVLGKASPRILGINTRLAISSGPAEFLGLLKEASLVVTNSFHGTAFSILFERPFVSIPHRTRNTRIAHLLETCGLTHLDYRSVLANQHSAARLPEPDFTAAKQRLHPLVAASRKYLDEALRVSTERPSSSCK